MTLQHLVQGARRCAVPPSMRMHGLVAGVVWLALFAGANGRCWAAEERQVREHAVADCVEAASRRHGVNPDLLLAILRVESDLVPHAVRRNPNGSIDVGIAQINSIHFSRLREYGLESAHLLDPCVGTYVAAWHLKNQILRHGNTWFAVGAYHSITPRFNQRYQVRVAQELRRMGRLVP